MSVEQYILATNRTGAGAAIPPLWIDSALSERGPREVLHQERKSDDTSGEGAEEHVGATYCHTS